MRIVEAHAKLMAYTPNMLKLIERAGRTCYKSEDKITNGSADVFVRKIIKSGHHSVLEHASLTFKFICDRGVTHELVGHRLCAYSQESTRYCNYGKEKHGHEITVIEPPGLHPSARVEWRFACEEAEGHYMELLSKSVAPQLARSVLPICVKTEIVTTANVREWRHILTLRTSGKAHPQIRKLMIDVYWTLYAKWPALVDDITTESTENTDKSE